MCSNNFYKNDQITTATTPVSHCKRSLDQIIYAPVPPISPTGIIDEFDGDLDYSFVHMTKKLKQTISNIIPRKDDVVFYGESRLNSQHPGNLQLVQVVEHTVKNMISKDCYETEFMNTASGIVQGMQSCGVRFLARSHDLEWYELSPFESILVLDRALRVQLCKDKPVERRMERRCSDLNSQLEPATQPWDADLPPFDDGMWDPLPFVPRTPTRPPTAYDNSIVDDTTVTKTDNNFGTPGDLDHIHDPLTIWEFDVEEDDLPLMGI
jgi:hypothetical protein